MFSKKFNSERLYIEVWITDQNSKQLELEDKINITLVKVMFISPDERQKIIDYLSLL